MNTLTHFYGLAVARCGPRAKHGASSCLCMLVVRKMGEIPPKIREWLYLVRNLRVSAGRYGASWGADCLNVVRILGLKKPVVLSPMIYSVDSLNPERMSV